MGYTWAHIMNTCDTNTSTEGNNNSKTTTHKNSQKHTKHL